MGKRHSLTNKNTEQDNNNNYRNGSKETGIYRNHKDGVAYKLFSGKKESLSLYNSIMRTDYYLKLIRVGVICSHYAVIQRQ